MTEILFTFPFREEDMPYFADIPGAHIVLSPEPSLEELSRAEIILGQPTPEMIRSAPKLRLVQCSSAGVDPYLKEQDLFGDRVTLTNLSGAFGTSISECVLAMVLSLYKHLPLFRDHQNACEWTDEGWQESPVGKNLLILGAGDIGTAVARLFRPFGLRITGMRRVVRETPPEYDDMITMKELNERLPLADIVVCALPDTEETRGLFSVERFALMKEGSVLVNVGRGSLIDQEALLSALNSGRLLGAALDVTVPEPLPKDHPLWKCRNLLLTPHITGGSIGHLKATEEKLRSICRENIERYMSGRPLLNAVDLSTGYRRTEYRY